MRGQAPPLARWAGTTVLALACLGCSVGNLQRAAELARLSEPWQQSPPQAVLRLLIVGDSTAVGTGATDGANSLAGLIGQAYPQLFIENRARDGATFADIAAQFQTGERFDMVLVQGGGNDVIRLRAWSGVQPALAQVAALAGAQSDLVVLMPAGNVGNAPFFLAPVSWLMTWRSRRLHAVVKQVAASNAAVVVDLFQERADDPFVRHPGLYAGDGLHPSDAGYRVWFAELEAQASLSHHLAAARGL